MSPVLHCWGVQEDWSGHCLVLSHEGGQVCPDTEMERRGGSQVYWGWVDYCVCRKQPSFPRCWEWGMEVGGGLGCSLPSWGS